MLSDKLLKNFLGSKSLQTFWRGDQMLIDDLARGRLKNKAEFNWKSFENQKSLWKTIKTWKF